MEKWMPATRRTAMICLSVLALTLFVLGESNSGNMVLGGLLMITNPKGE